MERPRPQPGPPFLPIFVRGLATAAVLVAPAACMHAVPRYLDPPPLPAGVKVEVCETTYLVYGYTFDDLEASLATQSPMYSGEHVWGLAQWRVAWTFQPDVHKDHCDVAQVRVHLTVDVILPEWQNATSASPEFRLVWQDFADAVRAHEYGHRDRAFLAAEEIHDTLKRIREVDCGELAAVVDARAHQVLERHRALDEEYERRTRRGLDQGAAWPPGTGY